MKLLLVDDNPVWRNLLKRVISLSPHSLIVQEAVNGKEAVKQVYQFNPDLVLMDFNMPEMNGLEASQSITKSHPDTKIYIVSSEPSYFWEEESIQAGVSRWINKRDAIPQLKSIFQEEFELLTVNA